MFQRLRPRLRPRIRLNRPYSTPPHSLYKSLHERGLINQISNVDVFEKITKSQTTVYLGADPSASSLHLGNMVPMMAMIHFYINGHTVLPVVGGATGAVGDPSGRKTERQLLHAQARENNVQNIQKQMQTLLQNAGAIAQKYGYSKLGSVRPLNNHEWWKDITFLDFLGKYGKYIRVTQMLARESIKQRLELQEGLGFNEFAYQVLQAYDYLHLYSTHNCAVQIGGQDQWGNIVAGIDLISRVASPDLDKQPLGLTVPLLTTPTGEKFGKSAGNAVFIDKALTQPYTLYQYLVNSPDDKIAAYLKIFTLMPLDEIKEVINNHLDNPEKRTAQHRLAHEVTQLVHGIDSAQGAKTLSSLMFGQEHLSPEMVMSAFESEGLLNKVPDLKGMPWKKLIATVTNTSVSNSARLIAQGGVYIGLDKKPLEDRSVEAHHFDGELLLIRLGKSKFYPCVEA